MASPHNKATQATTKKARRMVLNAALGLLTLAYPFAVYLGMDRLGTRALAGLLLGMFGLRLLLLKGERKRALGSLAPLLAAAAALCLLALLLNDSRFFLFYPVAVNLSLFAGFAFTLKRPPSMIERFARLTEPDLPEVAVAYCGRVTRVWCGFFLLNGLAAALTALFFPVRIWALYNGFLSYVLIGLLFAMEYGVRRVFKRKHAAISAEKPEIL